MALIVDKIDAQVPQTHVLVIGVATYPYLKNGTLSGKGIATHMRLDQLKSPVPSATHVARFFELHHRNPDAPLGSLDGLLSGGSYAPNGAAFRPVDEPTFDAVRQHIQDWAHRLDSHRDSVGIFYFYGHGLEPSGMMLLPQDFGSEASDPWNNAINFDSTYINLAQVLAKAQLFLIDACRNASTESTEAALVQAKAASALGKI